MRVNHFTPALRTEVADEPNLAPDEPATDGGRRCVRVWAGRCIPCSGHLSVPVQGLKFSFPSQMPLLQVHRSWVRDFWESKEMSHFLKETLNLLISSHVGAGDRSKLSEWINS